MLSSLQIDKQLVTGKEYLVQPWCHYTTVQIDLVQRKITFSIKKLIKDFFSYVCFPDVNRTWYINLAPLLVVVCSVIWDLPPSFWIFRHLFGSSTIFLDLPPSFGIFHHLLGSSTIFLDLPPSFGIFHHLLGSSTIFWYSCSYSVACKWRFNKLHQYYAEILLS